MRRTYRRWRLNNLVRRHPRVANCIERVRGENLSYLKEESLWDLAQAVQDIENSGVEGVIVEAGCALGGSALAIASAKRAERPFLVFDTFGMIPPPSDRDGPEVWKRWEIIATGRSRGPGGGRYYGYETDLLGQVARRFSDFGFDIGPNRIELIKGTYKDTLRLETPVALAHIDCDWYESVMDCLRAIEPLLSPGGRFVVDDYDTWSGCRKAVDEYFDDAGRRNYRFVRKSRMHILKGQSGDGELSDLA